VCQGALEVFEVMIGISLERCADTSPYQAGEFTEVIGLAGPIHGVLAIRCDEKTAIKDAHLPTAADMGHHQRTVNETVDEREIWATGQI
jgi:CheY-specific phosphatase CheX